MSGRQLIIQWIAGLICVVVLGIGTPEWMRRGVEQLIPGAAARRQSAEAARRDSTAAAALFAKRAADSIRAAALDTVGGIRSAIPRAASPAPTAVPRAASPGPAAVSVPPDTGSPGNTPVEPPASELELTIARWLILIGIPLALAWNTRRWYRARLTSGADTG